MSSQKQLLRESSIHGIRFMSDGSQSKAIRVFWTVAFVSSIGGMIFYARGIFIKFYYEPTIIQVVQLRNIREVPLPAFTICSPLVAQADFAPFGKFFKITGNNEVNNNFSRDEQEKLSALWHTCPTKFSDDHLWVGEENLEKTIEQLEKATPPVSQAVNSLKASHDRSVDPASFLNRVLTNHGICYSFNMLGYHSIFNNSTLSSDFNSYIRKGIKVGKKILDDEHEDVQWTPLTGYLTNNLTVFPHRIKKAHNDKIEVSLLINASDEVNLCPSMRSSYKLFIHQPNEMPLEFNEHLYLGLRSHHILSMTANLEGTSESLLDYSSDVRRCFKENERKLEFFKSYTKSHCVMECFGNYTMKHCGCKTFAMPRRQDTPICGLNHTRCLVKVFENWTLSEDFGHEGSILCNCLPACHRIDYGFKMISHVDYSGRVENSDANLRTVIELIFEDYLIEERTHAVSYKLANFVADLGGLLGLFMGCSLLSIVELFFFCVKICSKKRRNKNVVRARNNLTVQGEEFIRTLNLINADVDVAPGMIYLP